MNILLILGIGVICFGAGWLMSVKNINQLEGFVENAEQAIDYIEKMETPDLDMMNMILHQNRDANASLDILILLDLEKGKIDSAKERLTNRLASDYLDIKEDDAHEMRSLESENVIKRINELSNEHPSFRSIIHQSGWQNE